MDVRAANPGSRCDAWLLLGAAGALIAVFVGTAQRGLWEDGYFVIRFAHNAWHHASFAWNVSDGPIYGMTSQLLQLLGTLLYALAPHHMVLGLKALLYLAAFTCIWVIGRSVPEHQAGPGRFAVASVGLSLPLLLEIAQSGLETSIAVLVVAIGARITLAFARGELGTLPMAGVMWLVYLTRPDAVLIPAVLLALLGASRGLAVLGRLARVGVVTAAGFALMLLAFKAYYGTALPLPFYVKTQALAGNANLAPALFAAEKTKNAAQAAFFALPFIGIALHRPSREVLALLGAAFALGLYHYVATVETMGHHSRFYLPAYAPLLMAATLAYPTFLAARRPALVAAACALYAAAFFALARLDARHQITLMLEVHRFYPFLLGCALLVLTPVAFPRLSAGLLAAIMLGGALWCYPIRALHFEDDETILLRQIAPRRVFRGLAELRERLDVHTLFHTDMGAPGVLFLDARVVDLDGLLNEDVTLRHISFEALCTAERPDAIFVPNTSYARLRPEVLDSACLQRYRRASKRDKQPHLMIRADLYPRYTHGADATIERARATDRAGP